MDRAGEDRVRYLEELKNYLATVYQGKIYLNI